MHVIRENCKNVSSDVLNRIVLNLEALSEESDTTANKLCCTGIILYDALTLVVLLPYSVRSSV